MPTELRRLVFSNIELLEAILLHNAVAKQKLPRGALSLSKIEHDPRVSVTLQIVGETTQTIRVSAEWIAAALLRYCMVKHVPVPRLSTKSLQVNGDNLCLVIEMRAASAPFAQVVDDAAE